MSRPAGNVTFDNSGRVALVTGGASGIGRAICEALIESSATVVCADIADVDTRLTSSGVHFVKTDTSNEDQCRDAVEHTIEQHGALDILVNNAAIQPPASYVAVDEMPAEIWHKLVGVNFSGYTFMAKHALRQMKKQQSGIVIEEWIGGQKLLR